MTEEVRDPRWPHLDPDRLKKHHRAFTRGLDHQEQRQADLDLRSKLELPRMLVLSTAHITKATDHAFRLSSKDLPQFFPKMGSRHDSGDILGWIVPIVGDEPFPETCPEDLLTIRRLADSVGATWIMLDRDADTVDGLETWEW